jgi:hypothetical protein
LYIGKGWTCSLCKLDTFGLAYENWTGLVYGVVNAWFSYVWTDLVYECMVWYVWTNLVYGVVNAWFWYVWTNLGYECMILVDGFGQILE